ncbi:hypothetical protein BJX66DRAFT_335159 [Aspergillus keveii]|uniref:F-box domain-containing protein n=1 Tax=Aspergillus keveii TaxID=714993 RepID=A0ABR4GE12_9EURO
MPPILRPRPKKMRRVSPPKKKSARAKPSVIKPSPLLALPTELLVTVFQACFSFKDAATLAATSQQFNEVWKQHHTAIYNSIALTTTPCYPDLRQLLDDMGEIPADAQSLSRKNIARILELSKIGEGFVAEYMAMRKEQPYDDPQVPINPSPTEKMRLIRGYYQTLGLLKLRAKEEHLERIKSLDLKNLFLLSDFICVWSTRTIKDPALRAIIDTDAHRPRLLQREIRSQRNHEFRKLYGHAYHPIDVTPYEQGGRSAWWCDRQQEVFQKMVTGRVYERSDSPPKVRNDIWYDSAEED